MSQPILPIRRRKPGPVVATERAVRWADHMTALKTRTGGRASALSRANGATWVVREALSAHKKARRPPTW